ncbi:hypothetical protein [uncultured Thalassolituus sp.]|uniref:hypothetical protein n=1 Tax=uncultured Thalassolituus sp. TaxID=285273 RepID=UPI002618E0DC|nr:hypothetical protein [uncultured Thalassolituus sp.]
MRAPWVAGCVIGLLPFLVHAQPPSEGRVSARLTIEASSGPVPIDQMINGWESNARSSDFAFADGTASLTAEYQGWLLGAERRYYYLYEFTPDTVSWYEEVEQGSENSTDKNIDLDVSSFDARGVFAGYRFSGNGWSLTPSFTLYKLGHYQFGELSGRSSEGEGTNASAFLDYYFDEDKILAYEAEEGERFGYSLSVAGTRSFNDDWTASFELRDLWNRLEFFTASHRTGCINVGTVETSVCEQEGASVSGKDVLEDYITRIPVTVRGSLSYEPYRMHGDLILHGPYRNLTLRKDWLVGSFVSGVSVSSANQLGVYLVGEWFRIRYAADDLRLNYVRDAQLEASLFYQW